MGLMSLSVLLVAALGQVVTSTSGWPRVPPVEFSDLAYPVEALSLGQAGVVVVRVTTDDNGHVQSAEALTGPAVLVRAALDNVKTWTLSPKVRDGAMVFRFEIDNGTCRDDSRSLFRLVRPNFATVTACRAPGRPVPTWPSNGFEFIALGTPRYPNFAHNANMTGVVVLELLADAQGRIDPRPLTDLTSFTEAAVEHARQWRVRPTAMKRSIVVYEFALDNHDCKSEYNTVFWTVIPGYVRLSGCGPLVNPH